MMPKVLIYKMLSEKKLERNHGGIRTATRWFNILEKNFGTQMFISQLNFPFKYKEWILDLHKDE